MSRRLLTLGLLLMISLPVALLVVASCVGVSHLHEIVLSTSFPQRRHR